MNFGFTNDPVVLKAAQDYRNAAVADGWRIEPTYKLESVDNAASLHKNGYLMMVFTRNLAGGPKWKYEVSVSIWGPDGLAIVPPDTYDFAEIEKNTKLCQDCRKYVDETVRVSFAGRVCKECLPAARARDEKPGWRD